MCCTGYFFCGTNLGMTPPLGGIYRPKCPCSAGNPISNLGTRVKKILSNACKSCQKGPKRGCRGPSEGGGRPPGGMDLRGPGGPFRGGDPPRGGVRRGGDPPLGGSKRAKKGQKVANQGGPLGEPPGPLQIPYEKWAGWPDFDPPQGGPRDPPPPPGGDFQRLQAW